MIAKIPQVCVAYMIVNGIASSTMTVLYSSNTGKRQKCTLHF